MVEIFREGGSLSLRRIGGDKFRATIPLPVDAYGMHGRECPDKSCSPGYFKVKGGTGLTGEQAEAYCPYCRKAAPPDDFATEEQVRYATDRVIREAHAGVNRMLPQALGVGPRGHKSFGEGLFSVDVSFHPAPLPMVLEPREEELRRDVVCPACTLHHAVFGLATWCPDCGRDLFVEHVAAELAVVSKTLEDLPRRRELLGPRARAKDIENALEDVVSIFEAALRALTLRHFVAGGLTSDQAWERIQVRIGNGYQSVSRAPQLFFDATGKALYEEIDDGDVKALELAFEKRHPITHNLGVVDRKYLLRTNASDSVGRELRIAEAEVTRAADVTLAIVRNAQSRMFPPANRGDD